MDNIPFWRPYILEAERLCNEVGGRLFWKTKYENLDFVPYDVTNEVVDRVLALEDEANTIDPMTGEKRHDEY